MFTINQRNLDLNPIMTPTTLKNAALNLLKCLYIWWINHIRQRAPLVSSLPTVAAQLTQRHRPHIPVQNCDLLVTNDQEAMRYFGDEGFAPSPADYGFWGRWRCRRSDTNKGAALRLHWFNLWLLKTDPGDGSAHCNTSLSQPLRKDLQRTWNLWSSGMFLPRDGLRWAWFPSF